MKISGSAHEPKLKPNRDKTANNFHKIVNVMSTEIRFCTVFIMHQSFVSPAPPGPGNGGAFNFSFFKARVKARHCRARFVVKSLLKAPAPQRLTIMWNNR